MFFTRRKFIVGATKAVGLTVFSQLAPLGATKTWAQTTPPNPENEKHYFIHVRANFGMHPPMGVDPLILDHLYNRPTDPIKKVDSEFYAAYTDDDISQTKNGILLGAGAKPLADIIDDICIVNGILMLPKDVSHDNNRKYMSSGAPGSNTPFFAFQLLLNLAGSSSLGVVYSVEQDEQNFNLGPSTQFNKVSASGYANDVVLARLAVEHEIGGMTSAAQKIKTLENRGDNVQALSERYSKVFKSDQNETFGTMAAGLNSGLFAFTMIDVTGINLDTHQNHKISQPANQVTTFEKFAALIKGLKEIPSLAHGGKSSLYDHSTIILTSDFSRTSYANVNGDGTDHNPYDNSTIIAGGKIKTGQVIGASTIIPSQGTPEGKSRLSAIPMDFSTGRLLSYDEFIAKIDLVGACKAEDCLDYIKPSHIYTTLAKNFGLKDGTGFVKDRTLPGLLKG